MSVTFLFAEILNYQGSTHRYGVGSFNYIYTPIRSRDDDELEQLFRNLLEGELKNKYYSEVLNAYLYAWDQVMKDYFGENWKDKIEVE